MNQNGIIVTLGNFFAAIYIPTIYMLQPSTYVHTDSSNNGIWVWAPTYDDDDEDDDENNEPLRYEMNIGDEIRVRVKSIHYSKPSSTASSCKNGKPSSVDPVSRHKTDNATTATQPLPTLPHCAMYIIASICEDGLGLTSWWKNELDDDDDAAEEEEEEEEEDTAENGNAMSS
jgi:DNA-directed RNA polymerase III subunit RPC8